MREFRYIWVAGLAATALIIILPIVLFVTRDTAAADDPWRGLPQTPAHVEHGPLLTADYATGQDVTRACLECHETAAAEIMQTSHWTWESKPIMLPGRDEPVTVGKKNQLNNFCIGIQGNWSSCTSCHAGYGWDDAEFDFAAEENVDCLACHADANLYTKSQAGLPTEGVDLTAAAQSVGRPTRQNCGSCHFNGGGGNAVKHGDLDESLYFPAESIDVHMGRHDMECVDCHQTESHQVSGHLMSVNPLGGSGGLACTSCHAADLHADERISNHLDALACQTCHVPEGAVRQPTKMDWDWSTAGQDLPEDPHVYLKIKGSFIYEDNFVPTYAWYNGQADRYILGDPIDPAAVTNLSRPLGDLADPNALIWPFKVHTARQPYDALYNYLLVPVTGGEGGFWTFFDWDQAFRLNEPNTGLAYSGEYGFAATEMYWALTHMVQPKENALQCADCHGDAGRMDWEALGYYGDPLRWGGRAPQLTTSAAGR